MLIFIYATLIILQISDMHTRRSLTVSVTMTPAQSFHPSLRDDLSTVPLEDEEALATAPAPMGIINHDVNHLAQYLDGMDRQRVAEYEYVEDQLDRVEELADFVRTEATKSPNPAETVQDLPEHGRCGRAPGSPTPAVVLLDLPESPQAELWEHY
jgi:hypothetical protein